MNPIKSIASRYSLKTIPSNRYQTVSISGNTNLPMIKAKNDGSQDYVYTPYIMGNTTPMTIGSEWYKIFLIKERKIKLEKLKNMQNGIE